MGSEVVERVKGREKRVCHRKLREEKVLSHDSPKVASIKRRKMSLFVSGILKRLKRRFKKLKLQRKKKWFMVARVN